jgi:TolA-binding protein
VALLACAFTSLAATINETNAFLAAYGVFEGKNYPLAEKWFGDFLRDFPKSGGRPEAALLQAQARYFQTNSFGAISLLQTNLAQAGRLTDCYLFWIGEALFQSSNYTAAAQAYARVRGEFPSSTNALAASYNEALAHSRLGNASRVVELLRPAEGAFQHAALARPGDEFVARGQLLLAETQLGLKQYRDGEAALEVLKDRALPAELDWRRQYLKCRFQFAEGRDSEALQTSTGLTEMAVRAEQPRFLAESVSLRASIQEKLGQLEAAGQTYANNLATNVPPEWRRQALLKIVDLNQAQGRTNATIQELERFSEQYPDDSALDVAQETLGELRLAQYYAAMAATNPPASTTNLLQLALTNFNRVITGFPQSALLPKAHLNRGWCWWHLDRVPESLPDFGAAARAMPRSEEQALAQFKWAEVQYQLKDFTNSLNNFQALVTDYAGMPSVRSNLFDQALYKLLGAAIAVGDEAAAEDAVQKILNWFPDSYYSEGSLLRHGQAQDRIGKPAAAREQFLQFLSRYPESVRVPEVKLAIARTYQHEANWTNAAAKLDEWSRHYPTNAALPEAEFERAWAYDLAGQGTNAYRLFTNYVARFSDHANAPLAQNWVANYFLNQGASNPSAYVEAEKNFQRLFLSTNWPASELKYEAGLCAGQVAVARQELKAATNYFLLIINDAACPSNLVGEALFELGNTFFRGGEAADASMTDPWGNAINAFSRLTNSYPTHRRVPLALWRIGNCHVQLAADARQLAIDPKSAAQRYENATNTYQKAIDWLGADFTVRAMSQIGSGIVSEKQNLPDKALEHYQSVVQFEKILRNGETPDPRAVREAGYAAARLLEGQSRWEEAVAIYRRLAEVVPSLRATLEVKIARAQQNAGIGKAVKQ